VPTAPATAHTPPADSARLAARAVAGAVAVIALDALLLGLALGGPRALLAHTRALALLAVWGAGGIVLALMRPVRTHAPVALERESKASLIALLVVPVVTPAVGALGERLDLFPWFARAPIEWAGVALVAVGLGVRIAAMARLGSRFSPLVTVQQSHALETGGIYSTIRHPGYLGALLACLGGMLAFGSALSLPLVLSFAGLLGARMDREERLLERHFGDDYARYRRGTGRLLPRPWSTRG